jgi:hypothetical protein
MASASAASFFSAFAKWSDEFGCDQMNGMAASCKPAAPVMSGTARFHRYGALGYLRGPALECCAAQHSPFADGTEFVEHADREDFLGQIDANRDGAVHGVHLFVREKTAHGAPVCACQYRGESP